MRRFAVASAVALILAGLIAAQAEPISFETQVLRIEARQTLNLADEQLQTVPPDALRALVAYADQPVLAHNAQAALARYPEMSVRVLALYGTTPDFENVLRRYGASVVPPIHYYLENDSYSLHAMRYAGRQLEWLGREARRMTGDAPVEAPPVDDAEPMTPALRGWYAVQFINDGGHDFLGQFVVGADGVVERVQSERIIEGTTGFFTSGVTDLETKYLRDETLTTRDYAWAGVDLAVVAGAVKLLRAGRGASRAARAGASASRSGVLARTLGRTGRLGITVAKYGAVPAAVVLAVKYPGALSGLFGEMAAWAGWSPRLGQFAGWALLLAPLAYLGLVLMRLLMRPAIWLLTGLRAGVEWTNRDSQGPRRLFKA